MEEKKMNETEEAKTEENGAELSDEEMKQVVGGLNRDRYPDVSKRP